MGRLRPVVEGVSPAGRKVDELVADHKVARLPPRLEAPHRARPDHPLDPHLLEGEDVRPVRDHVGRELVLVAVSGQEGHALGADASRASEELLGRPYGVLTSTSSLFGQELVEP